MHHQVAVLAMDGHEVAGPHQAQHDLELLLGGVAADVDVGDAAV